MLNWVAAYLVPQDVETPLRWGTVRIGRVQLVGLRRLQMSKDTVRIECPFCESIVESPRDWIVQNQRLFCPTCCKAFDVSEEDLPKKIDYPDFWD